MKKEIKQTCSECQFESGEHSFSCSRYKPKKCPFPKEKSKPKEWEKKLMELKISNWEFENGIPIEVVGFIKKLLVQEQEKIIGERKCGKCGFDFIKMWKICPECGQILVGYGEDECCN